MTIVLVTVHVIYKILSNLMSVLNMAKLRTSLASLTIGNYNYYSPPHPPPPQKKKLTGFSAIFVGLPVSFYTPYWTEEKT